MDEGGIWRVKGYVTRKFTMKSGTFGVLTVEYMGDRGRKSTQEAFAFDSAVVAKIAAIGEGEGVDMRGTLMREALKDKAKNDIEVDGRKVWITKLRLLAVEVMQRKAAPPLDDVPATDAAELPRDERPSDGW